MTTIVGYEKMGMVMRLEQLSDDSGMIRLYDGDEYIGIISMVEIKEFIQNQ